MAVHFDLFPPSALGPRRENHGLTGPIGYGAGRISILPCYRVSMLPLGLCRTLLTPVRIERTRALSDRIPAVPGPRGLLGHYAFRGTHDLKYHFLIAVERVDVNQILIFSTLASELIR